MWGPHGHVTSPNLRKISKWMDKVDKESYQPMTIGHVAMRGTKEELSSPFLLNPAMGRGESRF